MKSSDSVIPGEVASSAGGKTTSFQIVQKDKAVKNYKKLQKHVCLKSLGT